MQNNYAGVFPEGLMGTLAPEGNKLRTKPRRRMTMSSLRIAEIFASLQGEGIWAGTPSTFVRVSGCNLRCSWCDTPYASWTPEGPMVEIDDIACQVAKLGHRHVVLTGGEPMLFDPIEALAGRLREADHIITIETAGTTFRSLPCDLMSISPKLSNSTPSKESGWNIRHEERRWQPQVVRCLLRENYHQLKFVVNPESPAGIDAQVEEIERFLDGVAPVTADRVLLMSEGTDRETVHRRERLLVETCMAKDWRLSPRLHIDLFGNERGT